MENLARGRKRRNSPENLEEDLGLAEIAAVACYLASARAGYVTGALVPVDGGTLVLQVDPRCMFIDVDFSTLTQSSPSAASYQFQDASNPGPDLALYTGMRLNERALCDRREAARKAGDYAKSDELRKELLERFGIQVKDTKDGTRWERVGRKGA